MQCDIFAEKEDTYYLNDGFFYIANMVQKQTENCKEDHVLRWMSPLHAVELLIHDHQNGRLNKRFYYEMKKDLLLYERNPFIVNLLFKLRAGFFSPPFYNI